MEYEGETVECYTKFFSPVNEAIGKITLTGDNR